jgi:hypothetical protein
MARHSRFRLICLEAALTLTAVSPANHEGFSGNVQVSIPTTLSLHKVQNLLGREKVVKDHFAPRAASAWFRA